MRPDMSPKSIPRVTVIVPNYNHELYLKQRIDSILCQTYQDLEIILLDDASKDGSADMLLGYQGHPKVQRVLVNEVNSGSPFKQWNKGLEFARGEYVWIAESDDYADPDFLKTLLSRLDADKDAGVAYCLSHKVDADSKKFGSTLDWTANLGAERWAADYVCTGAEECARYMVFRCIIPNVSSAVFRRQALDDAGRADDSMRYCGDYSTYVRVMKRWGVQYVAQHLNYFRFSSTSVRTQMSGAWLHDFERAKVLSSIFREFTVSKAIGDAAVQAFIESLIRTALSSKNAFKTYAAGYIKLRRVMVSFCSAPEWKLLSFIFTTLRRKALRALS